MSKKPTDTLQETGRTTKGTFAKGHVHNPHGRAKGSRNKATEAALALMDGQLEAITQSLIDTAIQGDIGAIKIILDKLLPNAKEKPIPPLDISKETRADAMQDIVNAVFDGDLTIEQAERLKVLIDDAGKAKSIFW